MKHHYYRLLLLSLLSFSSYSQVIQNQWTWIKGSKVANEKNAEFGLVGIEDSNNWPAGRSFASGIVDNNGDFLLFGGAGSSKNDLWKYNVSSNNWNYKKGTLNNGITGVSYSKGIGIEHYRNKPTNKLNAQVWKDNQGDMWVFGGGNSSTVYYNDLWKYNSSTNNWILYYEGTQNPNGSYGTKGISSANNIPPITQGAVTWTDLNGNLWMFGGETPNVNNSTSSSTNDFYNSLWKYDILTGNWTWMSGSSLIDQNGNYNLLGSESVLNMPGARANSGGWVDNLGNLWLFGGYGTSYHKFNDIWKYNPSTNLWTWVKGTSTSNENIVTTNTENINNMPLSISEKKGSYWKDNTDNFWYYDGSINNRMWMYNPITNSWTLKKESSSQDPIYSQLGVSNSTNTLGRRLGATTWTATNGDLYLFSGNHDSDNYREDLWKYTISTNQWTWVKGFNQSQTPTESYQRVKLIGLDDDEVNPGFMQDYCAKWTDSQGNLWVFGISGEGYDNSTEYNDLWKYDSSTNKWKWIKGLFDYPHYYSSYLTNGQLGVENFKNNPLYRTKAMSWIDTNDDLWLFGGDVSTGRKNDLWKFNKQTNMWVMINGSSTINGFGNYGQQGVASSTNIPGSRGDGVTWVDNQGDFWLFGGGGNDANGYGKLNDLWKYTISTNQWTWVKGPNIVNQTEVSAGIGVASPTNTPPSSSPFYLGLVSWKDNAGAFWLYIHGAMWKFDNNNWTKIKAYSLTNYGSIGVYSINNSPGYRPYASTWIDSNGNLLLFGGKYNSTFYQDLWKFDISVGQWVWIGGKIGDLFSSSSPVGNYGVQNEFFVSNLPGARQRSISWKDNNNNLFLYGGEGYDENNQGKLSDIWMSNRNFNVINGNIKLNTNNNNCSNSTVNVVSAKLTLQSNSGSKIVYTNSQGNYNEIVNDNIVTVTPTLDYFSFNPINQTANFTGYGSTQNLNFCASSTGVFNDLEITIIPINQAFAGEIIKYKIIYKNKGTASLNGNVSFSFNDNIIDYVTSSLIPNSQNVGNLNWNFNNIVPFESRSIYLTFNLNSPTDTPSVNSGDIINMNATVNSNATDQTINDNSFSLTQTVVNSMDPNDKTCLEGNIVGMDKVGEFVNYLIRFENTGTAKASHIVLKDYIDESKFDISSLTPVDASHNYKLSISDSNKVEIIFENINLSYPPSTSRYGYIAFKIKTKSNLVVGDIFSNTAEIYFDYNFPIITNNFDTTIQVLDVNEIEFKSSFIIYPNPVENILNIQNLTQQKIDKILITDLSGKIILSQNDIINEVNIQLLNQGVYILQLLSEGKSYYYKVIKK